jgi:hypothetical protein
MLNPWVRQSGFALVCLAFGLSLDALASPNVFAQVETLTLVPSSGSAGDRIGVTGTGWPFRPDVLVFTDQAQSTDPANAVARATPDTSGGFTTTMIVPDLSPDPPTVISDC